jgi:hypothetical protein
MIPCGVHDLTNCRSVSWIDRSTFSASVAIGGSGPLKKRTAHNAAAERFKPRKQVPPDRSEIKRERSELRG